MKLKTLIFSFLMLSIMAAAKGQFKIKDELVVKQTVNGDKNIGFITDQTQACTSEYAGFIRAKDSLEIEVCSWSTTDSTWVSIVPDKQYYKAVLYDTVAAGSSGNDRIIDAFDTNKWAKVDSYPSDFVPETTVYSGRQCIKLTTGVWKIKFLALADSIETISRINTTTGTSIGQFGHSVSNMFGTPAEAVTEVSGSSASYCLFVETGDAILSENCASGGTCSGPTSYFSIEKIK